jgi:hypothetical protein
MEYQEIDALGPIKVQKISGISVPPIFSELSDAGRLIYLEDTGDLYWGDGISKRWVLINDESDIIAHISEVISHNSRGRIVGLNALNAHKILESTHGINAPDVIAGKTDTNPLTASLSNHMLSHSGHGITAPDEIAGSNDLAIIETNINLHKALTTAHSASGAIIGQTNLVNLISDHKNDVAGHFPATSAAAGFLPSLRMPSDTPVPSAWSLNGMGVWSNKQSGGGSSGTSGRSSTVSGTSGTSGTSNDYSGSSGTSGTHPSHPVVTSGSSGHSGKMVACSKNGKGASSCEITFTESGDYDIFCFGHFTSNSNKWYQCSMFFGTDSTSTTWRYNSDSRVPTFTYFIPFYLSKSINISIKSKYTCSLVLDTDWEGDYETNSRSVMCYAIMKLPL